MEFGSFVKRLSDVTWEHLLFILSEIARLKL
jgi:hypothetical protein